ncbi:hypothetical protein I7I48_02872 [Histoplasma ohiense]|nr:hypothetical protein I7I48_02872 [Histoplasma ohiense (nom. inval.)]
MHSLRLNYVSPHTIFCLLQKGSGRKTSYWFSYWFTNLSIRFVRRFLAVPKRERKGFFFFFWLGR